MSGSGDEYAVIPPAIVEVRQDACGAADIEMTEIEPFMGVEESVAPVTFTENPESDSPRTVSAEFLVLWRRMHLEAT